MSNRRRMMMGVNSKSIIAGHEYVDLGLPSKTLWATMNVGADTIYDIGLWFNWGKTTGYSAPSNAPAYSNNKYKLASDPDELLLTDDGVAHNWGNGWRMPSKEQLDELIANTTLSTNSYGNVFTSNLNNKVLFVPFSGVYAGGNIINKRNIYIKSRTRASLSEYRGNDRCVVYTTSYNYGVTTDFRAYLTPLRGVYVKD